jgi:molecular chaperone HscB
LQRDAHPDRFAAQHPDLVGSALERSSDINEAYRILRDPMQRTKHLLSLYGFSVEQAKKVPAELLETVMNVQEKIAELDFAVNGKSERIKEEMKPLADELRAKRTSLDIELNKLRDEWDIKICHVVDPDTLSDAERSILMKITSLLAERAYINTLLASIEAAMNGESHILKH